jgi:hypothetical protein
MMTVQYRSRFLEYPLARAILAYSYTRWTRVDRSRSGDELILIQNFSCLNYRPISVSIVAVPADTMAAFAAADVRRNCTSRAPRRHRSNERHELDLQTAAQE